MKHQCFLNVKALTIVHSPYIIDRNSGQGSDAEWMKKLYDLCQGVNHVFDELEFYLNDNSEVAEQFAALMKNATKSMICDITFERTEIVLGAQTAIQIGSHWFDSYGADFEFCCKELILSLKFHSLLNYDYNNDVDVNLFLDSPIWPKETGISFVELFTFKMEFGIIFIKDNTKDIQNYLKLIEERISQKYIQAKSCGVTFTYHRFFNNCRINIQF
eukprot:UN09856